jgi:C-methyltransferase C-terminal domain/Putative zinc binding domain/Methyltransferase domain
MNNRCKGCGMESLEVFLDLGRMPLANSYLTAEELNGDEPRFPLAVSHCGHCHLVQLTETVPPEKLFTEYLYFSSFSESFLRHAAEMAQTLAARLKLGRESFVIEIASNDGYLLKNFVRKGIPVLGIEPARAAAEVAAMKEIPTFCNFFNGETARQVLRARGPADLIIGNNVLAHVPGINDFITAVRLCLKEKAVGVFEVPWLGEFLEKIEFDTIYHEHVFYYSLSALVRLFERSGLQVFDVEKKQVHGGSLRVFVSRPDVFPVSSSVSRILEKEELDGLTDISVYRSFAKRVNNLRSGLVTFLDEIKSAGKSIAAYGAAAKGSVFLNYCGLGKDRIDFIVDRSPYKQGRFMPGVHLPIYSPDKIAESKPDYLFILPWNLRDEIMQQMIHIRRWGGKFIVAIPHLEVF